MKKSGRQRGHRQSKLVLSAGSVGRAFEGRDGCQQFPLLERGQVS